MLSDAIQDGGDEVEEKKYQKTDAVALSKYGEVARTLAAVTRVERNQGLTGE